MTQIRKTFQPLISRACRVTFFLLLGSRLGSAQ